MPTITVWSDVGCPWAHVAVARLHRTRSTLGLDEVVRFDHRAFPLELFNDKPASKDHFDAEVPVLGGIEPDAGWQLWQAPAWHWPATTLPAMEAVQAAKEQSVEASEQLDRALRRALFAESRCVALRPVILEVARRCPAVDPATLAKALDAGTARRIVMDDFERAASEDVKGSPQVFLPDGAGVHNPGIEFEWQDAILHIERDEPGVYEEILLRATA